MEEKIIKVTTKEELEEMVKNYNPEEHNRKCQEMNNIRYEQFAKRLFRFFYDNGIVFDDTEVLAEHIEKTFLKKWSDKTKLIQTIQDIRASLNIKREGE